MRRELIFRLKRTETIGVCVILLLLLVFLLALYVPNNTEMLSEEILYDRESYFRAGFVPVVYGISCFFQGMLFLIAPIYGAVEMNADRKLGLLTQLKCVESEAVTIAKKTASFSLFVAAVDILSIPVGLLANRYVSAHAPEYKISPAPDFRAVLDYAGLFLSCGIVIVIFYLAGLWVSILVRNLAVGIILALVLYGLLGEANLLNGISGIYCNKSVFLVTYLEPERIPDLPAPVLWAVSIVFLALAFGITVLSLTEKKNGYET